MRKSVVNAPFYCLKSLGYFYSGKITVKIFVQQISALSLIAYAFTISNLQYFYMQDVADLIDNLETSIYFQLMSKLLFCIFSKGKILNLIQKSQQFWNCDACSKSVKKDVTNLLKRVSLVQKTFFYMMAVIIVTVIVPFSIVRKRLPIGIWKLGEDKTFYDITWCSYSGSLFYGTFFSYGFEGLFIGLIWEVMTQFKILCDLLEQMSVEDIHTNADLEEYYKKFVVYIEHHKFLMRFIQDLQDCYSFALLIQYVATAPVICAEIYAVFFESSSTAVLLQHLISLVALIMQFAIYCVPADYLAKETLTVANSIYNSNWYGKHFKLLRQPMLSMIQQAQREVEITALGGILKINSQTLLSVLRVSFSICTILRNLKQRK